MHALVLPLSLGLSWGLASLSATSPAEPAEPTGDVAPAPTGALPLPAPLAWTDFDGDGLLDLLHAQPGAPARLLRNVGAGSFEDASGLLGLAAERPLLGAQWIDFDADGFTDLFAVDLTGAPALLLNEGGTAFADVTARSGLVAGGVSAAQWLDYDRDGFPDLALDGSAGPRLYHGLGAGSFEAVVLPVPEPVPAPVGVATDRGGRADGGDGTLLAPVEGEGLSEAGSTLEGVDSADGGVGDASGGTTTVSAATPQQGPTQFPMPGTLAGHRSLFGNPTVHADQPACADSLGDQAGPGCLVASSVPALGSLYPLSANLFVDTMGRVGLGTTSPPAQLTVGAFQGGDATSAVAGFKKQAVISGPFNTGTNVGQSVKLLINDYDNDGSSDIYPIYAEDENNRVDFYVRNQAGTTSTFMDGSVGIGTTPNGQSTLRVINDGSQVQHAGYFATTAASNADGALTAVHSGNGPAVFAGSVNADGVLASGVNGVYAIGSTATGYGVVAENEDGMALLVRALHPSTSTPAAQIIYQGNGPAFKISTNDPTNPLAAEFEGDINLGVQPLIGAFDDRLRMRVNAVGNSEVRLHNFADVNTLVLQASEGDTGGGSRILLRDDAGATTLILDADYGGSSRVRTDVVEILGGADLVESFDSGGTELEPGTVVVASLEREGELEVSASAYDKRVLGIVSGAGGVRPGLHLAQDGVLDGETKVAISGRVYVKASAENGAIEPGDMLTSAGLAGHAMRATDRDRSFGAVIGKALSRLEGDEGLVLVLVGLQ